jgi:hypothetical protein
LAELAEADERRKEKEKEREEDMKRSREAENDVDKASQELSRLSFVQQDDSEMQDAEEEKPLQVPA